MTKLRGYIPTMLMLVTLMFGTTAANAGIILGDRTAAATTGTCEETSVTSVFTQLAVGIILGGRGGIILGDRSSSDSCTTTSSSVGIILGD